MAGIRIDITGDNANFINAWRQTEQNITSGMQRIEREGDELDSVLNKLQTSLGGLAAAWSVKEFVSNVAKVRGEFQQYEIAFKTMLQSEEKANDLMQQLIKTAAITPFGMTDITVAAKQLLAYGVAAEDVNETLTRLGDIAAGLSIDVGDLANMYGKAMVSGRLFSIDLARWTAKGIPIMDELAKQFGVTKAEVKELCEQGKIGFENLKQVIASMTDEGSKFGGLMEAQSHTISGQISNLEDAIEQMYNDIGKDTEGIISGAIEVASTVVEHWREIAEIVGKVAIAYGLYKAAVVACLAVQKTYNAIMAISNALTAEAALQKKLAAAASVTLSEAEAMAAARTMLLSHAFNALKAAIMSNPIGLIAVALAGLCYAIYEVVTAETAEEAARRKANEAMDEYNQKCKDRIDLTNQLLSTIRSETASELEKAKAYNQLATLVPTLTDKYTQQQLATEELDKVTKELNETFDEIKYEELKKQAEEYGAKVEELQKKLSFPANYAMNQDVKRQDQAKLEGYEEQLRLINAQLHEYEELQRKIQEESRPIEIRIAEAEENKAVYEELVGYYEKMQLAAQTAGQNASYALQDTNALTEQAMDELIADLQQKIDDAKAEQEANPLFIETRMEGWEQCLQDLVDYKNNWKSNGYLDLTFMANINFQNALVQLDYFQKHLAQLTSQTVEGGAKTFQDSYSEAEKAWKDATKKLNDINANKSKYTQSEYAAAKKELEDAKKAFASLGGDVNGKAASKAKQLRKQREQQRKKEQHDREQELKAIARYNELKRKLELERVRTAKDMELDTRQAILTAQEDSMEKSLDQLKLDFDRQEEEIKRGYDDLKQAKIDAARELFEANPANKGKQFDASTVDTTYTAEEIANSEALRKANLQNYLRSVRDTLDADQQYMKDYLTQYGSFESRKLAITKEYNDKIVKENNEWQKKMLAKERDRSIDEAKSQSLLDRVSFETIFSDYGIVLATPLQNTLEALQKYTESPAFKQRSLEDQKAIYEAISNARQQLAGIQGITFTEVGQTLYEYNNALFEYKQTSEELGKLAETVMEEETRLRLAEEDLAKATDESAKAIAQAVVNVTKAKVEAARANYAQGEQNFGAAQANLISTQNAATEALEGFYASIDRVGNIARAVASGSMKQLWDALGRKTQDKIAEFLTGTASFHRAVDELTKRLTDKGLSFGKFVNSIQNVAEQIAQAGEDIDKGEIGKKIKDMLEEVLGKDGEGIDQLGDKITKIIDKALSKDDKDASSIGQEVGDAVTKVLQATSSSGSLWGMIVGLTLDLLDIMAVGIGNILESILAKVGDAVAGVLSDIGSGKLFASIAEGNGKAIAGVVKGVANLFSGGYAFGGSNEDEMNEIIEEMAIANEALSKSIDSLTDTLKNNDNTNAKSLEAYREALRAEKEREANQRKAIQAEASKWTNSGYGFLGLGGKSSFNAHAPVSGWDGWKKFNEVLKKNGYAGNITGVGSMWTLSPEEMRLLRDFAPAEWAALFNGDGHGNPLELANQYIEMAGKQDELLDALNEQLTGYSWSGFKDGYASLLKDLSSDTEDFANNMEELITNALINSFINSEAVQGRINKLYKKIAKYAGDQSAGGTDLTKEELEDLRKDNEELAKFMLAWRKTLVDAGMIKGSSDSYSQEASKKGFGAMSQDTADQLNGRFTALQIAGERVANSMDAMLNQFDVVMTSMSTNNSTVEEIRNLMITSNSYLEDVAKYSKRIYLDFADALEEINDNIKKI